MKLSFRPKGEISEENPQKEISPFGRNDNLNFEIMNIFKRIIVSIKYNFLMTFGNKKIVTQPNIQKAMTNSKSFYDFKMKSIDGKEIDFSIYKNKKILIVNTASECGYTPQYKDLQTLHKMYGNKIIVLGFPANNFGEQEPANNNEIISFCEKNYGVTFQLLEKSDVIGENQNPLYQWLTDKKQNGWNDKMPTWNFCKYLIDENGMLLKFYGGAVSPLSDEVLQQL